MHLSLTGKTALVCGSTQGIGLATAQELALLGANCILLARNEAALQSAMASLDASQGQQHQYALADFSQPEAVVSAIQPFISNGLIHILVNNTGGPAAGAIVDAEATAFEQAFRQHILVNQLLTQAVLPGMKQEGFGRIINIVSTSVKIPLPNLGVSNTIRAAVAGWAKTMANELGQFGITVNNVLPGFTDTARLQSLIAHTAKMQGRSEAEVRKGMQDSVPAQRFGEASEIAAVAAFLASPAAAYVNGTSIPVDGGRTGSI
ncbi:3-oxoacyl-[acyl-carrier protein] reductase [Cnuella takakiae]|uniref:3-oxoacyl-[acyl-carrier protein] reductase n=1 Tax=Cnuella takakiae TaxID=1302690 RepID=A0A1M5HHX2_9BACT|nr:SDR family oxidoreductase [Cnuella takakiae]OLY92877.1 short-chain dehydrogenase [Cnuella takakiae]SHG15543.1 3-oxoacyl-[acyl-carrier protein] reductase [Cnuella takakiae]